MALQREFARIPILEAVRLRSRYSSAFYQMCCSWYGSKVRSWSMNIEELREWLHIEDGEFEMVGHPAIFLVNGRVSCTAASVPVIDKLWQEWQESRKSVSRKGRFSGSDNAGVACSWNRIRCKV